MVGEIVTFLRLHGQCETFVCLSLYETTGQIVLCIYFDKWQPGGIRGHEI